MRQYHALLQHVLDTGTWQGNRTGIPTLRTDGAMLQFDMADGFPAVTTKALAFRAVLGELLGFIRGCDNAGQFRALGCNVWNANANDNTAWVGNPYRLGYDDLGRIYGVQWRQWEGFNHEDPHGEVVVDQLANACNEIIHNPESRRILVNAWNPAELNMMALPPCHLLFQFLVNKDRNELSLCMYQRSCDLFLGIPFNIASYALLLHLVAAATGRKPARLTMFLADVHIYQNHMEQVKEQLSREPYPLPRLAIDATSPSFYGLRGIEWLEAVEPHHVWLEEYEKHPAIKADMAV